MKVPSCFLFILLLLNFKSGLSQTDNTLQIKTANVSYDSSNKMLSHAQIILLKEGAIVFRLKTNERGIAQYRKNGQLQLAEKIEKENHKRNKLIMDAFQRQFGFCKVYFIYANRTQAFLEGKNGLFLNNLLQEDSTIHLTEKFVVLAEYGTVMANVREDEYRYKGVYKTVESGQPVTTSAFFASDLSLTQLKEPMPFYSVVYLDNYYKAAQRWSEAFERYYVKVDIKSGQRNEEQLSLWLQLHPQHVNPYFVTKSTLGE